MSSTGCRSTIERSVGGFLHRHGIAPGAGIVLALSGGADSVCLLLALRTLRKTYPLSVEAAYLDHGIRAREEREAELRFVKDLCAQSEIHLTWSRLAEGSLEQSALAEGRSVEESAREQRYRFLREAAAERGAEYIAVAHTADDQVETVVVRLFQGSGLGGLPGIPAVRGALIRPLIHCTRGQVLDYLEERDQPYRTDSSNSDSRYLRNAVRVELLPVLEAVFPGYRSGVLSLSAKLAELRDYVAAESRRRLRWSRVRRGYAIPLERFLAVPGLLRVFSVTELLNRTSAGGGRIPHGFLSQVADEGFLRSRRIPLRGHGICMYRRGEQLILSTDVVGHREKGYFIEENAAGAVSVPAAGLFFQFGSQLSNRDFRVFRSAMSGDRIDLAEGNRAVGKVLAGWRVSGSQRWKIPIVEDRFGIAAILGELFGYSDRFRSGLDFEQGKALKSMVHRYDVEVE